MCQIPLNFDIRHLSLKEIQRDAAAKYRKNLIIMTHSALDLAGTGLFLTYSYIKFLHIFTLKSTSLLANENSVRRLPLTAVIRQKVWLPASDEIERVFST